MVQAVGQNNSQWAATHGLQPVRSTSVQYSSLGGVKIRTWLTAGPV